MINVSELQPSEIKFSRAKSNSGRRFIVAYYNKKNLALKLPKLRIPFDSRVNQFDQLEINVSLGSNQELIDKIKDLDEKMIEFALEHNWFNGKAFDYTPTLKESKNNQFPPTLRIKVPNKDNVIKTLFFNKDKTKIEINDETDVVSIMKKGTHVQTAIECVGVWINESKFGLSWKAEQVRIISKPEEINEEYTFDDSDDEEISDTELLIDDSDDE